MITFASPGRASPLFGLVGRIYGGEPGGWSLVRRKEARVNVLLLMLSGGILSAEPVPPQPIAVFQDTQAAQLDEATRGRFVRNEVDLLTDKRALDALVGDPTIKRLPTAEKQEDLRKWLRDNLRVEPDPRCGQVRVSFRDGDRTEQVILLRVVAEIHLKRHDEPKEYLRYILPSVIESRDLIVRQLKLEESTDPSNRRADYERRLALLRTDLENVEASVEKIRKQLAEPPRVVLATRPE
jgi:hypothetical protein